VAGSYGHCSDVRAETRIVEPEGTAVARKQPINAFVLQEIGDPTSEETAIPRQQR
jgi:hypothetical protein